MGGTTERWACGVDGCRAGWIAVLARVRDGNVCVERHRVISNLDEVLSFPESPRYICVDIPIGLPSRAKPGGRACDRAARQLLGPRRGSSVFSPPVRAALRSRTYSTAVAINRRSSDEGIGLNKQIFNLFPKLREADGLLTSELQSRVREAHPEVSFAGLNGGKGIREPKRSAEGMRRRLKLLEPHFPNVYRALAELVPAQPGLANDDVIDAYAVTWSAIRMLNGLAERIPAKPERDGKGLRMEIWF